ncbi:MAG: DEAD/DEAH box helicase [bacterium]
MALHPIIALDNVIREYRDYLQTEFQAKDPELRKALENELDAPLFLAQEPFFQAHRPFRQGKRWQDLPIDPRLAKVMETRSRSETAYLHQSRAIETLLSPDSHPVVVTTGTGSGKTEAFLLPVIQNAVTDSIHFKEPGLTALLIYPMNALANDQLLRINEYLSESGFKGVVSVARYDQSTSQQEREDIRSNPPHILLTNYMMLEYLLVRPSDRERLFTNHRCRFLVLDEVHSYRGSLGSNIALLVRRLKIHLKNAGQTYKTQPDEREKRLRYPDLVTVGTSATIKSISEEGGSHADAVRRRDEAVQGFFSKLTGDDPGSIRVYGEELQDINAPDDTVISKVPYCPENLELDSNESLRKALINLTGLPADTALQEAARRAGLLWELNKWLIKAPSSLSQLVNRIKDTIAERKNTPQEDLTKEVETALVIGAALPDDVENGLKLRAHRFIRGGWQFHRCLNTDCGKLYPMGEEQCSVCGYPTAPLFLCRNCGADYYRFTSEDPEAQPLKPSAVTTEGPEWLLYDFKRMKGLIEEGGEEAWKEDDEFESSEDMDAMPIPGKQFPEQIKKRPVIIGSFDPQTLRFSADVTDYPMPAALSPARTRCLCCGASASSRSVITSVALGTSAALKVIAEGLLDALSHAHRSDPDHDGKERLLIFSDSRQDASHQARFILFSSRYDRMRRRLIRILEQEGAISIQKAVELFGKEGVDNMDNPYTPSRKMFKIPAATLARIRAYEEAPLLDDLATTTGYRGTILNLGLVGVQYEDLNEIVHTHGNALAASLGISLENLVHVCRCLLDEMLRSALLSRPMLCYHPANPAYPDYMQMAEWERRIKYPKGLPYGQDESVIPFMKREEIPYGIVLQNAWRTPKSSLAPSLEKILRRLLDRFGGVIPTADEMTSLLEFLLQGGFVTPSELHGYNKSIKLLQLNEEIVLLKRLESDERFRCDLCEAPRAFSSKNLPCPLCDGKIVPWRDEEIYRNRYVRRILADRHNTLVAGEHTAQVTNDERMSLEERFKAPVKESKVNVLACSPTLEMGIDVGGLDAVALRNIPPRPDNYAQRGGRAGRRKRVGLIVGYARSTPHDQYFYDKPAEMIAGEVPAPSLALGNRDVILRHLNAVIFGVAEPGLSSQMIDYVSPKGEIKNEAVNELIEGIKEKSDYGVQMALDAFGDGILRDAKLDENDLKIFVERLPEAILDVIQRTSRQVIELRQAIETFSEKLEGKGAATRAAMLVERLLGFSSDKWSRTETADTRSDGYPMRRFAEFGILPGYEFPTQPAALRLLGDVDEGNTVNVGRIFGIGQYQPDAQVYARTQRWRVVGLDTSSPWNPRSDEPSWIYFRCKECGLIFNAQNNSCPRCKDASIAKDHAAFEFGGFLACRDENPVLNEEDRYAEKNLVRTHPQWDGDVKGRWSIGDSWTIRLNQHEEVRWINEGKPPSRKDLKQGVPIIHQGAKGYYLCESCGKMLTYPDDDAGSGKGKSRKKVKRGDNKSDPYGHSKNCIKKGTPPRPVAIVTKQRTDVLRILIPVPETMEAKDIETWGLSMGYSLRIGMRHLYMLDGSEINFELEGPWKACHDQSKLGMISLTFIDPSIGGTGYLEQAAHDLHRIAGRALEHLNHKNCETACYRCLKSYANQRFHDKLNWTLVHPILQMLSQEKPVKQAAKAGDINDPKPWLEAYKAGVGSPLELKFLRIFEDRGFHPQKQVPIVLEEGMGPISIADFAVPEKRLAIYVDGLAFHQGMNLRRDRYIRDRMRNAEKPWRVVELGIRNLNEIDDVMASLEM